VALSILTGSTSRTLFAGMVECFTWTYLDVDVTPRRVFAYKSKRWGPTVRSTYQAEKSRSAALPL